MRRAPVLAALAAVVAFAAPALAQSTANVTGTWELSVTSQRGTRTMTFTFKQDGATLTGTTVMRSREGEDTVQIKDGKVDGNTATWTVERTFGQRTMSQTYKATVKGDAMEGTISGGRGGEIPFKGTRQK
jgi:hypothetical protein